MTGGKAKGAAGSPRVSSSKSEAVKTKSKSSSGLKRAERDLYLEASASAVATVVALPEPRAKGDASSLVRDTVAKLRNMIMFHIHENGFLGSEDKLINDLGVSRPTFRQAARLLQHEQLLTIKRGVGGGFFARMPSAETVKHMMSIYLMARGVTLSSITQAGGPLITEAARLVAANPSREVRAKLSAFVDEHAGFENSDDTRAQAQVILAYQDLLATLSGNPVIELLAQTINRIVREPRYGTFKFTPERTRVYAEYQRRLAAAVLDGDPDVAAIIAQRHMHNMLEFLSQDLAKGLATDQGSSATV
ncbi:FadR/GntR family transcriptional regulator [Azospirillum sp. B510]|uniref:FadR/GntR family transcriptional regulator n=1 Tax=Azospirillum sp. (strain B510) TaxID=137722 RepID=UPI0011D10FAD|nr:FCD domain-containing protein [Azospirillum sp. B510]